jgi:hypothetical protein
MMLGSKIISNNVYVDELSRAGKLEMPITTLFIGSYHRAIYILMKLDDEEEAIATKLWRVQFDDPETKAEFLYLWPDALCVDGCWWLVKDCITRGWLIDRGASYLEEVVAIEFASLRLRKRFMDEADH